jgi:hypothetical protein
LNFDDRVLTLGLLNSKETHMSKLNVGVGEDFPLGDDANQTGREHACAHYWRHRHGRHRHHPARAAAAIVIIPAGVAAVTTAILYPLTTLGVIGGLGLVAAAHRRGRRWERYREEYRRWREEQRNAASGPQPDDKPRDEPSSPPKETI